MHFIASCGTKKIHFSTPSRKKIVCKTGKTFILLVWLLPSLCLGIKLNTCKIYFFSLVLHGEKFLALDAWRPMHSTHKSGPSDTSTKLERFCYGFTHLKYGEIYEQNVWTMCLKNLNSMRERLEVYLWMHEITHAWNARISCPKRIKFKQTEGYSQFFKTERGPGLETSLKIDQFSSYQRGYPYHWKPLKRWHPLCTYRDTVFKVGVASILKRTKLIRFGHESLAFSVIEFWS